MKRILIFTFILIGFRANSQALIWEDDFESYTVDELLEPQSDEWYGWGGTTDTWVSDDYALNGTKSMLISNMGSGTDVLHDFNITSGHWKIVVNAFYKSGQGGYFNILNSISPLNWSLEFFIGSEETYDGSGAGLFRNDPPVLFENQIFQYYQNNGLDLKWILILTTTFWWLQQTVMKSILDHGQTKMVRTQILNL